MEKKCPKCNELLKIKDKVYALIPNNYFPGTICEACNTIWSDDCEGYKAFMKAAKERVLKNDSSIQEIQKQYQDLGDQIGEFKALDNKQAIQLIDLMEKYYNIKERLFIYGATHSCEINKE